MGPIPSGGRGSGTRIQFGGEMSGMGQLRRDGQATGWRAVKCWLTDEKLSAMWSCNCACQIRGSTDLNWRRYELCVVKCWLAAP